MTKIKILCATLYTLLAVGANPLAAESLDINAIKELRAGDMRLVAIHSEPKPMTSVPFFDGNGNEIDLSEFEGKTILLNFWATWCAPCRAEMPSLDALNQELGGETFEVVTVATGRNPPAMIKKFFDDNDISSLPQLRDPKMKLARSSGVLGLPVTLVVTPDGAEIARLQGEADWNSEEAYILLKALIASNL